MADKKKMPKYLQILSQDKDEKKKADAKQTFQMSQSTLQQAIIRKEGEIAKKDIEAQEQVTNNPPDYDEFLRLDNAKEVLEIEKTKLIAIMAEYFNIKYTPMVFED